MTSKQLYSDVSAMGFCHGFSDGGDDGSAFISAVNRALDTLSARFPLRTVLELSCKQPTVLSCDAHIALCTGETVRREAEGASCVSLEGAHGTCVRFYEGDACVREVTLGEKDTSHRVFVSHVFKQGKTPAVELSGDCGEVFELLFFKEPYACAQGRRTHEKSTDFLLDALAEGALDLETPPVLYLESGGVYSMKEGKDYRLSEPLTLTLPHGKGERLRVTLRRRHRRFTPDCEVPDVHPDGAHLLPLLTAAYALLDTDSEKALYYLALYRENLPKAVRLYRQKSTRDTVTLNGW